MTLDKAIERVKEGAPFSELYNKEWEDALSTVVRAASLINNIKKEIQADMVKEITENYISRQALKEQMLKYGFHAPDMTVTEFVEDLSPANQKPKTGHWIYGKDWTGRDGWYCNQCRRFEFWDHSLDMKSAELNLPNVCPKCGAKMRMTVDDILQWLADHFEHPCNYTFDDVDVPVFMVEQDPDYCETHCDKHNVKECWRKYLELYFKGMKVNATERQ